MKSSTMKSCRLFFLFNNDVRTIAFLAKELKHLKNCTVHVWLLILVISFGLNVENTSSDFLILAELLASDNLYGDFTFTSLPIVIIDTDGQPIPNEPKIAAEMKIINNPEKFNRPTDPPTDYNGAVGIEVRGHHSSGFPQRPYSLETRDELGENLNVSLLGLPAENDWILLSNYNDKTFLRTSLGFDLFRMMGHYAPRVLLCEVFLDYEYRGIYTFTEKIKRDKNRVDIARLNPDENTGDDVTGGYIIKVDYHDASNSWKSKYSPIDHPQNDIYFVYYYPKAENITREQKSYIQDYIEALEDALYGRMFDDPVLGYRNFIDVSSFIDYFFVSEVSRNVDGYKKSRYLYKDRDSNGGLLHAGPVWDFDWAWKNIRECYFSATDGSGWSFKSNDCNYSNSCPGWYVRLLQDSFFTHKLIDRYFELRSSILDMNNIYAYIDSVAAHVDEAKDRHFELWPIERDYRTPEVDPPSRSYEEQTDKLKEWIRLRINWLDINIPKLEEKIINNVSTTNQSENSLTIKMFPNPAINYLWIESTAPIKEVKIYNIIGQQVFSSIFDRVLAKRINVPNLPPGIYFIKVVQGDKKPAVYKHIFVKALN